MDFEVTPQPSDQERAAIEAALGREAQEERSSAWADALLPTRGSGAGETDDPRPPRGRVA
jgi:hypothetical protein